MKNCALFQNRIDFVPVGVMGQEWGQNRSWAKLGSILQWRADIGLNGSVQIEVVGLQDVGVVFC